MERPVDGDVAEVEAEDLVERGVRFGFEPVEHASRDPLVAASSQRRVRHLVIQDRFDIDPRRAGHEPDQDPAEAQVVIGARPVTAQRVRTIRRWEQRLDRPPENIDHFPLEGAHDVRVPPPGRWLLVQHPGSNLGAGRGSAGQGTAALRAMGRDLGNNMVGISDLGQMGSRITRLLSRLATLGFPGGAATSGPVDSLLARCGVITRGRQRGVVGVAPNLAFDFDDALLQLDYALLQLADPGLELLDELTECATVGLKGGVARYAG